MKLPKQVGHLILACIILIFISPTYAQNRKISAHVYASAGFNKGCIVDDNIDYPTADIKPIEGLSAIGGFSMRYDITNKFFTSIGLQLDVEKFRFGYYYGNTHVVSSYDLVLTPVLPLEIGFRMLDKDNREDWIISAKAQYRLSYLDQYKLILYDSEYHMPPEKSLTIYDDYDHSKALLLGLKVGKVVWLNGFPLTVYGQFDFGFSQFYKGGWQVVVTTPGKNYYDTSVITHEGSRLTLGLSCPLYKR